MFAIKFKEKAGGGGRKAREAGKANTAAGKANSATDALRCLRFCTSGDEVVLSTSRGTILRQRVDDVSVQARSATGVLVQKLAKDDSIVEISIVPPESDEEEATVNAQA